jgi:hypothetical protein
MEGKSKGSKVKMQSIFLPDWNNKSTFMVERLKILSLLNGSHFAAKCLAKTD